MFRKINDLLLKQPFSNKSPNACKNSSLALDTAPNYNWSKGYDFDTDCVMKSCLLAISHPSKQCDEEAKASI